MYVCGASQVAQWVKNPPAMQEMQETCVWSLGWKDSLGKEVATYSSILTWRIPWTEEPGRLQSMGSQRVGHDWSHWACTHMYVCTYINYSCFIHLSVDGHLGCFCVLVIVNNASVNTKVHIYFFELVFIFLGWLPRSEIAAVLFFNFWGKLHTVSIVAIPFYNPRQYKKIPFLHILVNTFHLWPFW